MSNDKPSAIWHPGTGPTPRAAADVLREARRNYAVEQSTYHDEIDQAEYARAESEFDEALAEHDAQVAARAWDEGFRSGSIEDFDGTAPMSFEQVERDRRNPYRADRIAGGAA